MLGISINIKDLNLYENDSVLNSIVHSINVSKYAKKGRTLEEIKKSCLVSFSLGKKIREKDKDIRLILKKYPIYKNIKTLESFVILSENSKSIDNYLHSQWSDINNIYTYCFNDNMYVISNKIKR